MSTISPPATIPVPFTTGDITMDGGSYTGDVGSTDKNNPATLRLTNGAIVNATVGGFQDPGAQPGITPAHYADFEIYGKDDKLTLSQVGGGGFMGAGPGFAQVNLQPGAELDGAKFTTATDGFVSYNNGTLGGLTGTLVGGGLTVNSDIIGTGTVTMNVGHDAGGTAEINAPVDSGETITVNSGHLILDQAGSYNGAIDWVNGQDGGAAVTFMGVGADSFAVDGQGLHLYSKGVEEVLIKGSIGRDAAAGNIYQTAGGVEVKDNESDPTAVHLPPKVNLASRNCSPR